MEYKGGVQGKVLKWMKDFLNTVFSFLKNRKMRTILRGKYSTWNEVTTVVLAPIMFLAYINYIKDNIGNGSYINMFADDAKIQEKNLNRRFMFGASK